MRTQLLVGLVSLATSVAALQQLSVKVTGPSTITTPGDFILDTIITNTGDEPLSILNDPNGALSDLPTDKFNIADPSGAAPSFHGVRAKYVPATAVLRGAYTTLAPQQSATIRHDLSSTYAFTNTHDATYTIAARHAFTVVNTDGSTASLVAAESVVHSALVSGNLARRARYPPPPPPPPPPPARKSLRRRAQYTGCSSDQQSVIAGAISEATTYAQNGQQYVTDNSSDSSGERFTTWFGTGDTGRADVSAHLLKISSNDFDSFTYDCSTCQDAGVFAYVYPDQFGQIYLCPEFWNAPPTGTDSQGGTIVHEASHFLANGGTKDYAYGQPACQTLAIDEPDKAVNNADSYEYFVENNPALD